MFIFLHDGWLLQPLAEFSRTKSVLAQPGERGCFEWTLPLKSALIRSKQGVFMNRYSFLLLSLVLAASFSSAFSEDVVFYQRPQDLQLFTRDATDSAAVRFRGQVVSSGYTAIECQVLRDGVEWSKQSATLNYGEGGADFDLAPRICAGMHDYAFVIALKSETSSVPVLTVQKVVCGDAYILTGQSNAHYAWSDATFQNNFCRTFGVKTGMSNYDPYSPADTLWNLSQGYSGRGPGVGTLGLYIQKMILEETGMPTCLINGGTGGSVIAEHLPNATDPADLSTIYGKTCYRVRKAGLERVRAVIWHQGENDCNPQGIAAYADRFAALVDAWETDFGVEKIYLYQIRPGTGGESQSRLRDVQRRLPEILGSEEVIVQSTNNLPGHDGLHYAHIGYQRMAKWVTDLICADFYASQDTVDILPPAIRRAVYHPESHAVHLFFADCSQLIWPADTLDQRLEDYFYFDGDFGMVQEGWAAGDSAVLQLSGPQYFEHVTYLPDRFNNNSFIVYQGPWLHNSRSIGALSFYQIPLENSAAFVQVQTPNGGEAFRPQQAIPIEWRHANVDRIRIEFHPGGEGGWQTIAENVSADSGRFAWVAPAISSLDCRVRIADMQDDRIADESNAPFRIFTKTLSVLSPNGGESWPVGSTQTIMWNSQFVENTVQIQASYDNGATWSIVKRMANVKDGQSQWAIPDRISDTCLIKIFDMAETEVTDISDAPFSIVSASAVDPEHDAVPDRFVLQQNYPNPFNPVTRIRFHLPCTAFTRLTLFDATGRQAVEVIAEILPAGEHRLDLNAAAIGLSSGVLFYRLESGGSSEIRKMVFLK